MYWESLVAIMLESGWIKFWGKGLANEWIDQKVVNRNLILMVLVWRIVNALPNSPNFPSAVHSHYKVLRI